MQWLNLAEIDLGLSHAEIMAVFTPFVAQELRPEDAPWRAELNRRHHTIGRQLLKKWLLGWLPRYRRNEKTIIREYDKAWQLSEYDHYALNKPLVRISPWQWQDRCFLASDVGATRFRQLFLIRLLEQLKPRRLVEIGCGNGINLLLLAGYFPDIEMTGLELTQQGHHAALQFQQQTCLPEAMQSYAPLPLADLTAFRRIRFIQGSAAELPFATDHFDVVLTILALEQMEALRHRALREIARVTGKWALLFEPFRDVNDQGWARYNILRRGYFQGRIGELQRYELNPLWACTDFPQETFLKTCAVLVQKARP